MEQEEEKEGKLILLKPYEIILGLKLLFIVMGVQGESNTFDLLL